MIMEDDESQSAVQVSRLETSEVQIKFKGSLLESSHNREANLSVLFRPQGLNKAHLHYGGQFVVLTIC